MKIIFIYSLRLVIRLMGTFFPAKFYSKHICQRVLSSVFLLCLFGGSGFGEVANTKASPPLNTSELLLQISGQLQGINQRLKELEDKSGKRFGEIEQAVGIIQYNMEELKGEADSEKAKHYPDTADLDVGEMLLSEIDVSTDSVAGVSDPQASQTSGSVLGRIQNMNPNISVLSDFVGHTARRTTTDSRNRFSLRELEIAFQGAIDPYSRYDLFITVPDGEEIEVEEGFVTLLNLPGNLRGRVGKFRSPIGKINRVHGPELPQVDRPNVITNLFGEEGLAETGVSVSKILPLPWFSEVEVGVFNGDNTSLFGHGRVSKPLTVGHFKNFFELTERSSLEVGASGALGARDRGMSSNLTSVAGVDMTYRWIPAKMGRSFIWQTEFLTAHLEDPVMGRDNLTGFYSYIEKQFNRRFSAGVRVDYSEVPSLANIREFAIAPYVNFWQSEFGRLRLEYKHTHRANAQSNDQLWLQYTATLGTHKPHPF